jgi:hypothetical protein
MNSSRLYLWLIPLALYLVFCVWYTNLGGPLSNNEIDAFVAKLEQAGASPERIGFVRTFMEQDSGRQFVMINSLQRNKQPPELPATGPDATADDLLAHYMEHMFPALLARASHPIFSGDVVYPAMDLTGIEGAEVWDQGALFRYRSRRDLMEIATDPAFDERHDYKLAGLTKTIAYPVETALYYSDVRLMLALVLFALVAAADLALYRRPR